MNKTLANGRLQQVIVPGPNTKGTASTSRRSPDAGGGSEITVRGGQREGSISVRKISNGYIVREGHYDGNNFQEVETFTEDPPTIRVEG